VKEKEKKPTKLSMKERERSLGYLLKKREKSLSYL